MSKLKPTVTAPLLVLLIFILLRLSLLIDVSSLGQKDNIFLSSVVLQLVIFCIPGIFYCRLKPSGYMSKLRFRLFGINKLFFVIVAFFTMVLGTVLIKLAMFKLGWFFETEQLYDSFLNYGVNDAKNTVYIVIALGLIPAICEEFIFRSILLTEYRSSTKSVSVSVVVSALLFSLMHFSLSELPIFFFSGIILAATAYVTDSIVATVLMHFANNLLTVFLESHILNFVGNATSLVFLVFVFLVLFLVCCILFFGEGERIYYNKGINGVIPRDDIPLSDSSIGSTGNDNISKTDSTDFSSEKSDKTSMLLSVISSPSLICCILFFIPVALGLI